MNVEILDIIKQTFGGGSGGNLPESFDTLIAAIDSLLGEGTMEGILQTITKILTSPFIGLLIVSTVLIMLATLVAKIVGMYGVFKKAGINGWFALIPVFNNFCLAKVATGNYLYGILLYAPVVSKVYKIVLPFRVAHAFGKNDIIGLLVYFFPFLGYPLVGFGKSTYQLKK